MEAVLKEHAGHIAGIVNPPSKKKYGHYTNDDMTLDADAWRETAEFHEGSWWPRWDEWLATRSGGKVPARTPGTDGGATPGAARQALQDFAEVLATTEEVAKTAMTSRADPHALVEALANTQLAVETAVTVRDRVVEAYQEILRMPV